MERGNWEDHKLLFGEENRLKPCPFCGAEPYVDSCDRIIDIGCDKCGYHLHFHGLVQSEIETPVVASKWNGGLPAEWYDKDAYEKAAAGWNRRAKELCEMIDDAPTVETKYTGVKCAECIHWNETAIVGGEIMDVPGVRYCELMEKNLFEWDYCSYAVKRVEGEEDG